MAPVGLKGVEKTSTNSGEDGGNEKIYLVTAKLRENNSADNTKGSCLGVGIFTTNDDESNGLHAETISGSSWIVGYD